MVSPNSDASSSGIGTYVLALWLGAPQVVIVGRMGELPFRAGWHLYVGSARGPGGLQARLARHRRRLGPGKRGRWHVDFLREQAEWGGAWGRPSGERLECAWASRLCGLPGAEIAVPGFGSSDCRCPGHLVYVPTLPSDGWILEFLGADRLKVGSEDLEDLLRMLATGEDEVREKAAVGLGRYGAAAGDRLVRMLCDKEVDTRWWAARALAEVGGSDVVPPLIAALADADADVRACASLALGRSGDGAAAQALATRLADESTFVASVAADALSMIGELAVESMAGMLTHQNPHVRLLAVRALGRIKSHKAIAPLLGVLEDPSYLVRFFAQEALEALEVGTIWLAS